MGRAMTSVGAGLIGAVSLYLLGARMVRSRVTDARASQRLIKVLGHGWQDGAEYLEFDALSFAAHPGQLSMRAAAGGDLLLLGAPRGQGGARVRRAVLRGDSRAVVSAGKGKLSGHLGETPADFGFAFETVMADSHPAWVIPGASPDGIWVIHVHGLGSSRSQCLRGLQAFADAGFTSMVPSYRTSLDAGTEQRRSHLGVSEYRDIEEARRHALRDGASGIIFVGWSLGASIVLRTIGQVPAPEILGALLISPALDWPAIITAHLRRVRIPETVGRLIISAFNNFRLPGEPVIRWKEMPGTHMQNYPVVPTMIFHGSDDQSVPVELSRMFVARQSARVRFVEFQGAHHTLEWNSAPELWNQSVHDWCRSIGLNTVSIYPTLEAK